MFIKELFLNIRYLEEQMLDLAALDTKAAKDLLDFSKNLLKGIAYYRQLSAVMPGDVSVIGAELSGCEGEINTLIGRLEGICNVILDKN